MRAALTRSLLVLAAAALAGCAHRLVVTSDPPGRPVIFDGRPVGVTPLAVEESEAYALHRVQIGEGPDAVTRVVVADRLLAKDAASAALLPLGAACFVPLYWTAGTDDRVHVAARLSGEPIGAGVESDVALEYLPPEARFPHGTATELHVVDGKHVQVMTDRRPFVTTVNFQGLSLPYHDERVAPAGVPQRVAAPVLSFGLEQEWLFTPRFSVGLGAAYRSWERAVVGDRAVDLPAAETRQASSLGFREWRTGALARYRHPVLRWPGSPGGLDLVTGLGLDFVDRFYFDERGGDAWLGSAAPWVEAGLDVGLTRPLAIVLADRVYPLAPARPGGVWGSLGAEREHRLVFGVRLFW